MSETVIVRQGSRYGKEAFWPECKVSELFCELLSQKSLTRKNIEVLKKLGFKFEIKWVKI